MEPQLHQAIAPDDSFGTQLGSAATVGAGPVSARLRVAQTRGSDEGQFRASGLAARARSFCP